MTPLSGLSLASGAVTERELNEAELERVRRAIEGLYAERRDEAFTFDQQRRYHALVTRENELRRALGLPVTDPIVRQNADDDD